MAQTKTGGKLGKKATKVTLKKSAGIAKKIAAKKTDAKKSSPKKAPPKPVEPKPALEKKSLPKKIAPQKKSLSDKAPLPSLSSVEAIDHDAAVDIDAEIKSWANQEALHNTIHDSNLNELDPLTTPEKEITGSAIAIRPSASALQKTQADQSAKQQNSRKVSAEIVDKDDSDDEENPKELSQLPATVTDGLSLYLSEIRRYPLLTREQELDLAKRYFENHDPKDAERLVTSNLRFVVKVAAEYAKFGSRLIDLIQEGNVGLMHAVKEFNPYKGVRLITYAVWWIRGYIQEYLMRQYSMVRIGTTQNQRKLFYRLDKERERLHHEGIEATPKLLSDRLGVTEDEVRDMQLRLSGRDLSLDQPLDTESSARWIDFESDGEDVDLSDQLAKQQALKLLHSAIADLRDELNPKEIKLLDDRILSDEPKKLQEIGEEWGVSREAVRQMEARLMKKIKNHFDEMGEGMSHD